jgi:chemotaxis protein histidine kinase CheA
MTRPCPARWSCSRRWTAISTGSLSFSTRCAKAKTNVALPWTVDKDEPTPAAEVARAAASEIAAATPTERTVVVSLPKPDYAPSRADADAVDVEGGGRAMLRVRADIIDRLVNEAGEVAIARARIESELRALKANLLELTGA